MKDFEPTVFAADGHDAGGCERVTGKSGMRPVTPADPIPLIAVEAASRLWAYRETKRPSDGAGIVDSEAQSLASALYRCGASSLLRSLKSNSQT